MCPLFCEFHDLEDVAKIMINGSRIFEILCSISVLRNSDCLHGLRTTLRYVLVHPLSFF